MKYCRACGLSLGEPLFSWPNPSMTSAKKLIDCDLSAFICPRCALTQIPPLPEAAAFYDKDYRISLDSDDFDQLYTLSNGVSIYRTDYQADILIDKVKLAAGDMVLDYGAGKGTTLRKLLQKRPNILPHIFDVSNEYREYWKKFLPESSTATYSLPQSWRNAFALVTANFVLEHVGNPYRTLKDIAGVLKDNGTLFFIVPNIFSNPGNLLARDHVNHFSIPALEYVLSKAGLTLDSVDDASFRGAYVCVAKKNYPMEAHLVLGDIASGIIAETKKIAQFWARIDMFIRKTPLERLSKPSAIFGAGLYGAFIRSRLPEPNKCLCFLDNNSHLVGTRLMGLPIRSPKDLPEDLKTIYMGVNPNSARNIQTGIDSDKPLNYVFLE